MPASFVAPLFAITIVGDGKTRLDAISNRLFLLSLTSSVAPGTYTILDLDFCHGRPRTWTYSFIPPRDRTIKSDQPRTVIMNIALLLLVRNNVVVLFGTLNVQSFMLTEVRDCDLLIVVTSSTFLTKDILKGKR